MKAIGIKTSLPVSEKDSLIEFETTVPKVSGHDLLVSVKAVSLNPVDYKVRLGSARNVILKEPKVLGWDAAGIVEEVGEKVTMFKKGDAVFYAGDITRPGCNAAYHLVNEKIVGHKPRSLSYEEAASVPLTGLTAWEGLFERLRLKRNDGEGKNILIISGAGGVGSMAIQLAKKLTRLTVIATASRPKSADWCKLMGADVVVNHTDLLNQLRGAGIPHVDYILNLVDTDQYWNDMSEVIRPMGSICCIVPAKKEVNLSTIFNKSVTFGWELMFTRSSFQTDDMIVQHQILDGISELYDKNILLPTLTHTWEGMTAENFRKGHEQLESGRTIGKVAIKF